MGGTTKWMKSLITGFKKNDNNNNNNRRMSKESSGSSKSKIRRSSSKLGNLGCLERKVAPVDFAAVVEAVVRAPLKDFQVLKKEWAATRIQTAFRGFLARRALRALKAVVRLQAIFRGQRVRKQAVIAFRSMEAVMRAQIRVRLQRAKMVTEGEEMQFEAMSKKTKAEKLSFKAAKSSTSALEVLSEKNHQNFHNINNGFISLERGISAKPSKRYNTKSDKKLNAAEARCSDLGLVKEKNSIANNLNKTHQFNPKCKQNRGELLTSASDFGFSKSPAASSSSSITRPILLESEGTEEVSSSNQSNYITLTESIEAKKRIGCAQRMRRFCRELQSDIDSRNNGAGFDSGNHSRKKLEKKNVCSY